MGEHNKKTIWKKLNINTKWKSKPQEFEVLAEATPLCFPASQKKAVSRD